MMLLKAHTTGLRRWALLWFLLSGIHDIARAQIGVGAFTERVITNAAMEAGESYDNAGSALCISSRLALDDNWYVEARPGIVVKGAELHRPFFLPEGDWLMPQWKYCEMTLLAGYARDVGPVRLGAVTGVTTAILFDGTSDLYESRPGLPGSHHSATRDLSPRMQDVEVAFVYGGDVGFILSSDVHYVVQLRSHIGLTSAVAAEGSADNCPGCLFGRYRTRELRLSTGFVVTLSSAP